jgi:3-carboxy-cis,cis-muconate cycloisomerase
LTSSEGASGDYGLLDPLGKGSRSAELLGDAAWLQAMVDAEVALIRALVNARMVPAEMTDVAASLSVATELDLAGIAADGRAGGNPVIPLVKRLSARAETLSPGASDSVHLGATSQDILDTAAMLISRRSIAEIEMQLSSLRASLSELASLHRSTPMPGRTLGQHASPTSFGLVAAGWLDAVLGASERLRAVDAALPGSLGGSVGTLGVLTEVARARRSDAEPEEVVASVVAGFTGLLSLRNPGATWHTNRLPVVELAAALASVVGAIGTFAIDVSVLSRTEIAEVSERLGAGEGSSSAMPHKRNPVSAVLLVAAARQSPALVSTLLLAQVAEDQRPSGAWHAEWAALRQLEKLAIDAATAAASLAERLEVDAGRMRSNLDITDGLIYSERVSTVLAESIGKTEAFELVGAAAREAVETHRPLRVVVAARLSGTDEDLRARVWAAFDPDSGLGVASEMIDAVLARARESA